ncbi:chemotaxis protein CheW [Geminocystis sp. GBBB08]|uniref:chemotaxis protein CheW n=1 Tax=Geminocystis sp. GBBB08 TaxID=2604140 RepID=UPI0027E2FD0B|nr:chemotaxis protein CheW [Geminocystis sp. GBBB08]MBL1210707.1 hypothetical protein [Geminocystis sp. GBBB08]
MDYFIVELNDEQKIAIPLDKVQEVMSINYNDICPIPGVKSGLLGVVSQRGNLLWLLDLSRLLLNFNSLTNRFNALTILVTKLEENYIGLVIKKLGEIKDSIIDNSLIVSEENILNNYCQGIILDTQKQIPIIELSKIKSYVNELGVII